MVLNCDCLALLTFPFTVDPTRQGYSRFSYKYQPLF